MSSKKWKKQIKQEEPKENTLDQEKIPVNQDNKKILTLDSKIEGDFDQPLKQQQQEQNIIQEENEKSKSKKRGLASQGKKKGKKTNNQQRQVAEDAGQPPGNLIQIQDQAISQVKNSEGTEATSNQEKLNKKKKLIQQLLAEQIDIEENEKESEEESASSKGRASEGDEKVKHNRQAVKQPPKQDVEATDTTAVSKATDQSKAGGGGGGGGAGGGDQQKQNQNLQQTQQGTELESGQGTVDPKSKYAELRKMKGRSKASMNASIYNSKHFASKQFEGEVKPLVEKGEEVKKEVANSNHSIANGNNTTLNRSQSKRNQSTKSIMSKNNLLSVNKEAQSQALTERELKEMQNLALCLGIDFQTELQAFQRMLREMVNQELPANWIREVDPQKNIIYYNRSSKEATKIHPNATLFRAYFYDKLAALDQQNELKEMAKNFTKGRVVQTEENNNGESATLKAATGKPPPKTLISKKKSMLSDINLKSGQQNTQTQQGQSQVFKFMDEGKSKERYTALLTSLGEYKLCLKQQEQRMVIGKQTEGGKICISEFDRILQKCALFYEEKYGLDPKELEARISQETEYRRVDPEEIVNAIIFLNLNREPPSLFWLARVYVSIETPADWQCLHLDNEEGKIYYNKLQQQRLSVHPCYYYVLQIIKICKANRSPANRSPTNRSPDRQDKKSLQSMLSLPRQSITEQKLPASSIVLESQTNLMVLSQLQSQQQSSSTPQPQQFQPRFSYKMMFEDCLFRAYEVDIGALLPMAELLNNDPDGQLAEESQQFQKQLTEKRIDQIGRALIPPQNKRDSTLGASGKSSSCDENENRGVKGRRLLAAKKKKGHLRMSSNLNDNHLMAICKEFGISLPEEAHLLAVVTEFLIHKDQQMQQKGEIWKFRQMPEEESYYWLQQQVGETSSTYPFSEELSRLIALYRKVINKEMNSKNIKIKRNVLRNILQYLYASREDEVQQAIKYMRLEARAFVANCFQLNAQQLQVQYLLLSMDNGGRNAGSGVEGDPGSKKSMHEAHVTQFLQAFLQAPRNDTSLVSQQPPYKLRYLMKFLRTDIAVQDEDIKNNLLFQFPYQLDFVAKKQLKKQPNYFATFRKIQHRKPSFSSSSSEDEEAKQQERLNNKPPTSFNMLMQKHFMEGDFEEEKFHFSISSSEDPDDGEDEEEEVGDGQVNQKTADNNQKSGRSSIFQKDKVESHRTIVEGNNSSSQYNILSNSQISVSESSNGEESARVIPPIQNSASLTAPLSPMKQQSKKQQIINDSNKQLIEKVNSQREPISEENFLTEQDFEDSKQALTTLNSIERESKLNSKIKQIQLTRIQQKSNHPTINTSLNSSSQSSLQSEEGAFPKSPLMSKSPSLQTGKSRFADQPGQLGNVQKQADKPQKVQLTSPLSGTASKKKQPIQVGSNSNSFNSKKLDKLQQTLTQSEKSQLQQQQIVKANALSEANPQAVKQSSGESKQVPTLGNGPKERDQIEVAIKSKENVVAISSPKCVAKRADVDTGKTSGVLDNIVKNEELNNKEANEIVMKDSSSNEDIKQDNQGERPSGERVSQTSSGIDQKEGEGQDDDDLKLPQYPVEEQPGNTESEVLNAIAGALSDSLDNNPSEYQLSNNEQQSGLISIAAGSTLDTKSKIIMPDKTKKLSPSTRQKKQTKKVTAKAVTTEKTRMSKKGNTGDTQALDLLEVKEAGGTGEAKPLSSTEEQDGIKKISKIIKRKQFKELPKLPLPNDVREDFEANLKKEKTLQKKKNEQKEKNILQSLFSGYNNKLKKAEEKKKINNNQNEQQKQGLFGQSQVGVPSVEDSTSNGNIINSGHVSIGGTIGGDNFGGIKVGSSSSNGDNNDKLQNQPSPTLQPLPLPSPMNEGEQSQQKQEGKVVQELSQEPAKGPSGGADQRRKSREFLELNIDQIKKKKFTEKLMPKVIKVQLPMSEIKESEDPFLEDASQSASSLSIVQTGQEKKVVMSNTETLKLFVKQQEEEKKRMMKETYQEAQKAFEKKEEKENQKKQISQVKDTITMTTQDNVKKVLLSCLDPSFKKSTSLVDQQLLLSKQPLAAALSPTKSAIFVSSPRALTAVVTSSVKSTSGSPRGKKELSSFKFALAEEGESDSRNNKKEQQQQRAKVVWRADNSGFNQASQYTQQEAMWRREVPQIEYQIGVSHLPSFSSSPKQANLQVLSPLKSSSVTPVIDGGAGGLNLNEVTEEQLRSDFLFAVAASHPMINRDITNSLPLTQTQLEGLKNNTRQLKVVSHKFPQRSASPNGFHHSPDLQYARQRSPQEHVGLHSIHYYKPSANTSLSSPSKSGRILREGQVISKGQVKGQGQSGEKQTQASDQPSSQHISKLAEPKRDYSSNSQGLLPRIAQKNSDTCCTMPAIPSVRKSFNSRATSPNRLTGNNKLGFSFCSSPGAVNQKDQKLTLSQPLQDPLMLQQHQQAIGISVDGINKPMPAFNDNYSHYKLKSAISHLAKKLPLAWFDVRESENPSKSQPTNDGPRFFQMKAVEELNKLKNKAIRRKLDLLIFDFLIEKLGLPPSLQQIIQQNSDLKLRFYRSEAHLFRAIRNCLCGIDSLQQQLALMVVEAADPDPSSFISVFGSIEKLFEQDLLNLRKKNVFEQLIKTPPVSDYMKGGVPFVRNNYTYKKKESISCDDINPFTENFVFMTSNLVIDSLFQPSKKVLLDDSSQEEEKLQQLNAKEAQGLDLEEEEKEMADLILRKNAVSQSIPFQNRGLQKQRAELRQRSLSSLFLYKRLLECQEYIQCQKQRSRIFTALVLELKEIHLMHRQIIHRFDNHLDFGLTPNHVYNMCRILEIDISREADQIWIAVLYCLFLIKYSQGCDVLEIVLRQDFHTDNEYSQFFQCLVTFNRIKREFLLQDLPPKSQADYFTVHSWFKFYDPERDIVYNYNILTKKSADNLPKSVRYLQEKYYIAERVSFLKLVEGLYSILQTDQTPSSQAVDKIRTENCEEGEGSMSYQVDEERKLESVESLLDIEQLSPSRNHEEGPFHENDKILEVI